MEEQHVLFPIFNHCFDLYMQTSNLSIGNWKWNCDYQNGNIIAAIDSMLTFPVWVLARQAISVIKIINIKAFKIHNFLTNLTKFNTLTFRTIPWKCWHALKHSFLNNYYFIFDSIVFTAIIIFSNKFCFHVDQIQLSLIYLLGNDSALHFLVFPF